MNPKSHFIYTQRIKPVADVVLAALILIGLLPLLVIISLIQLFVVGTKIFFIQQRIGFSGKAFYVIKFRTMTGPDTGGQVNRITGFGKVLRNYSLDELPQLINVLTGKMSLIGPRPLPVSYEAFIANNYPKRSSVRPGLSGLAQVSGRNSLGWEEKLRKDCFYAKNQSFKLDWIIFLRTFRAIFNQEDVDSSSSLTMPKLVE